KITVIFKYLSKMLNLLSKIFGGNKSDKDVKKLLPIVDKVNKLYESYTALSNHELRGKTGEFRRRLAEYLQDINQEIDRLRADAEQAVIDMQAREGAYDEVDKLIKKRDEKLEEILEEIMP